MKDYKGYSFRLSTNTGGKAGKGCNDTRSLHVTGPIKGRYFSFKTSNPYGMAEAHNKAIKWIDKQQES